MYGVLEQEPGTRRKDAAITARVHRIEEHCLPQFQFSGCPVGSGLGTDDRIYQMALGELGPTRLLSASEKASAVSTQQSVEGHI